MSRGSLREFLRNRHITGSAVRPPRDPPSHGDPCDDRKTIPFPCAICMEPMSDPCTGGACSHHFCGECLKEWVLTSLSQSRTPSLGARPRCPTCRAPIERLLRDPEFASAIGVTSAPSYHDIYHNTDTGRITTRAVPNVRTLTVSWPPGMTLTSVATNDSYKCYVTGLVPGNGAALAGVVRYEILARVNGMAVAHSDEAVRLIEQQAALGSVHLGLMQPTDAEHVSLLLHLLNFQEQEEQDWIAQSVESHSSRPIRAAVHHAAHSRYPWAVPQVVSLAQEYSLALTVEVDRARYGA